MHPHAQRGTGAGEFCTICTPCTRALFLRREASFGALTGPSKMDSGSAPGMTGLFPVYLVSLRLSACPVASENGTGAADISERDRTHPLLTEEFAGLAI